MPKLIPLEKLINGLPLFNLKGEQFEVASLKLVDPQTITCWLKNGFGMTAPITFLVIKKEVDLKNFSIVRPSRDPVTVALLSPSDYSKRIVPKR